ncbi:MAG: hypothetical protein R3A52_12020 [Polyangiales bacterium]
MRRALFALCLLSLHCDGETAATPDASVDATVTDIPTAPDASTADAPAPEDARAIEDVFTRTAPPACPSFTPRPVPQCGTGTTRGGILAADVELDAKARRFDRVFHAIHAAYTGVNAEATANDDAVVTALNRFLRETDGWDYEASSGAAPSAHFRWDKVAGAYAGAGAMADALRYAVLRDEGAACDEVSRARDHLHAALDGMHRAVTVAGTPGVIARGYIRRDLPGGEGFTTTPLFDAMGRPLPPEKTNGTWRDPAASGPQDYIWEDSCSRDMLIGWALGMAAAWEVSRGDTTVDAARLATLRADALAIGESLRRVNARGYDLEIHDADGRVTYNGYLSEHALDRVYIPGFDDNGQHAVMALGIIAAFARITDDPGLNDYLHNDLIRLRNLPGIARDRVGFIDVGEMTNFSNYNMAFTGAWLAHRYLCDDAARAAVREATVTALYDTPGMSRQPAEMGQSFFDLVAIQAMAGGTAWRDLDASTAMGAPLTRATTTLREFPDAPFWETPRTNCDDDEVASGMCVGDDGTVIPLSTMPGRGDSLVAAIPIPMRIRPPSNFYWRSDPYRPNGGGTPRRVLPGVDFRLAYWMGRYLRAR